MRQTAPWRKGARITNPLIPASTQGRINDPHSIGEQRGSCVNLKDTRKTGAGYKIRTRDILITNQALYQLS
jgi:hypothetical protein